MILFVSFASARSRVYVQLYIVSMYKVHRRLYVNSVIWKNDERECSSAAYVSKARNCAFISRHHACTQSIHFPILSLSPLPLSFSLSHRFSCTSAFLQKYLSLFTLPGRQPLSFSLARSALWLDEKMSRRNGTARRRRKWRGVESGNIVRESLFPRRFGKNG